MARLFNVLAVRELMLIQIARYSDKKEHWVSILLCLRNMTVTVYIASVYRINISLIYLISSLAAV